MVKYIIYRYKGFKEGKTETFIHSIALEEAAETVARWRRCESSGAASNRLKGTKNDRASMKSGSSAPHFWLAWERSVVPEEVDKQRSVRELKRQERTPKSKGSKTVHQQGYDACTVLPGKRVHRGETTLRSMKTADVSLNGSHGVCNDGEQQCYFSRTSPPRFALHNQV